MKCLCCIWSLVYWQLKPKEFMSSYYALTVFFHWIYSDRAAMKIRLLLLAGAFIGLLVWMSHLTRSMKALIKNKLLLILRLSRCVRGLKNLQLFWPFLMTIKHFWFPLPVRFLLLKSLKIFTVGKMLQLSADHHCLWSQALFMTSLYAH